MAGGLPGSGGEDGSMAGSSALARSHAALHVRNRQWRGRRLGAYALSPLCELERGVFPGGEGRNGQGMQDQFDSGRDSELVKNPKEVVLDGVFRQTQPIRDLAVGQTLGDTLYH